MFGVVDIEEGSWGGLRDYREAKGRALPCGTVSMRQIELV